MNLAAGPLLNQINHPDDLKKMSREQLHQVCDELRQYIIDIVSVHGGHFAASLYNSLSSNQLAPTEFHAFPRLPLPLEKLNGGLDVDAPPLIKGYLKLGAKICSAPAWDPDFNTADMLVMLPLSRINRRYAAHFFK